MNQKFEIARDPYFDLSRCVTSGQVFRWQREDDIWTGYEGENLYRIEMTEYGLSVETNASQRDFENLFRLDWNAEKVEADIIERGPELALPAQELRGLRLLRPSSAEETFFTFLCTANNHLSRIGTMVRALAAYGDEDRFPSVDRIAAIDPLELRAKKFGYRADSIVLSARQLQGRGPDWLDTLRTVEYETAFNELLLLRGVGPKLADCICLFGLDHTEAVPVDTHIWQQIVRHYRPDWADKSLTLGRYRDAGAVVRDRFGEHAGWAQQILFYDNLLNWRTRG
ncbi:DNA-3-methyladenine glycosylase [soil metagenome]